MSLSLASLIREVVLPPTSLLLVFVAGVFLGRWHKRLGLFLRMGSMAMLFFLSTGVGTRLLVTPLEGMTQVPLLKDTGAQAIVVLAAGRYAAAPEYGGDDVPDYIALGRLRYAARLHRETGLPVLVSGGNTSPNGRFMAKALSMAKVLREEFNVPVKWVEGKSDNTAQNAAFSAKMLLPEDVTRIFLVTDAMHMQRSVMAFRHNGFDVIAAPTVFLGRKPMSLKNMLPGADHLQLTEYAIHEWIGLAWYALCYRMNQEP